MTLKQWTLLVVHNHTRAACVRGNPHPVYDVVTCYMLQILIISLPTVGCRYADSRCDTGVAINEAFKFYAAGGVDVILGPCCDYAAAPVARQVTCNF